MAEPGGERAPPPGREAVRALAAAGADEAEALVRAMGPAMLRRLARDWPAWARPGQEEPAGDWRTWLIMAGRGFGKTRAGAEWVCAKAAQGGRRTRIALVAATPAEARAVMIEGKSGLIAVSGGRARWLPSRGLVVWPNGARAFVHSAANPDGLRGPEHHFAWCDELAKWKRGEEAWTNLMLGLRLGGRPRALVTTPPRPTAILKAILAAPDTVCTGGASRDNPMLPPAQLAALERDLAGTRLARQELEGVLADDSEGALWRRDRIEEWRCAPPAGGWRRVAVGVDPPASAEGTCGISVCGVAGGGIGYVLADLSARGIGPDGWARKVAEAAEAYGAGLVVAEANNGGAMVESVLRGAGVRVPVRRVHASEGKSARAAPVAMLFESGRARFAGNFPELEDELAGLSWDQEQGGYQGPGDSPDRADAMVWALTALMLDKPRPEPRIRTL